MGGHKCAVSKDGLLAIGFVRCFGDLSGPSPRCGAVSSIVLQMLAVMESQVAPSSLLDCCFAADGVGGSHSVNLRIADHCGLKLPSP
ncbi:hypothetical protein R1flu_012313 [Riccia fluitans]|uniref:Uncharacterized protein n=1 Tax=Riccia fluitans TaxID=41844 RepID=A0ABD1ZAB7_9MARC